MSMTKVDLGNVTIIEGMSLMKYCDFISKSRLVPTDYQGKPADIFLAIKWGQKLGLSELHALKNIAVINGRPSIWGDAAMALVQVHPKFEDMKEYYDINLNAATCIIKRKGMSEHTVTFSMKDAELAGLHTKDTWKKYPTRMLQMRARGRALNDRFADALGGLILAEEAQDYPLDVTPSTNDIFKQKLENILTAQEAAIDVTTSSQPVISDSVSISITEEEERAALAELIKVHNVSEELINKWHTKEGINNWEELDIERVRKYIDHINTKKGNSA